MAWSMPGAVRETRRVARNAQGGAQREIGSSVTQEGVVQGQIHVEGRKVEALDGLDEGLSWACLSAARLLWWRRRRA